MMEITDCDDDESVFIAVGLHFGILKDLWDELFKEYVSMWGNLL